MRTNGITFYKIISPYIGDFTKNCGLTGEEIDANFLFLRGNDIESIFYDKDTNELTARRFNGEKISCVIDDFLHSVTLEGSSFTPETGILHLMLNGEEFDIPGFPVCDCEQIMQMLADINCEIKGIKEDVLVTEDIMFKGQPIIPIDSNLTQAAKIIVGYLKDDSECTITKDILGGKNNGEIVFAAAPTAESDFIEYDVVARKGDTVTSAIQKVTDYLLQRYSRIKNELSEKGAVWDSEIQEAFDTINMEISDRISADTEIIESISSETASRIEEDENIHNLVNDVSAATLVNEASISDLSAATISDERIISQALNDINIRVNEIFGILPGKQNTLTAGDGIAIENDIISTTVFGSGDGQYSAIQKGAGNVASGDYATATGFQTKASGMGSHTEGYVEMEIGDEVIEASGDGAHAEGSTVQKILNDSGTYTYVFGSIIAKGDGAHAEGSVTKAYGDASHAEGFQTNANAPYSHAEGLASSTLNDVVYPGWMDGVAAHAEGNETTAGGRASHAEGDHTVTNNPGEHAEGRYNVSHFATNAINSGNTIHSVGIGTPSPGLHFENSRNAFEIMQNGDAYMIGIGDYDGINITSAQTLQKVIDSKADISCLKYEDAAVAGQYVSAVDETDGIINVTRADIPVMGVKDSEKVVSLDTDRKIQTTLDVHYDSTGQTLYLTGINGDKIGDGISVADFIKDGMLDSASLSADTTDNKTYLVLTFNTEAGKQPIKLDVTTLVDVYTAGNGIDVNGKVISVKRSTDSEEFLTVESNGIKLSGVQTAINTAKTEAISSANTYTNTEIGKLDFTELAVGAAKTLGVISETDGKISATAVDIQIAESQVTNLVDDLKKAKTVVAAGTNIAITTGTTGDGATSYTVATDGIYTSAQTDTAIITAINALDATVGSTTVESGKHVAVQVVETDGVLTSLTVTENDIASATDLTAEVNRATSAESVLAARIGALEDGTVTNVIAGNGIDVATYGTEKTVSAKVSNAANNALSVDANGLFAAIYYEDLDA